MSAATPLIASIESGSKLHLSWDPEEKFPLQVLTIYFERQLENLVQVIRIYELFDPKSDDQKTHPLFEFPFSYEKGYWSVKGIMANKSYYAEIGVKLSENKYFPLLRSNSFFLSNTSILDEQKEPISHMYQNQLTTPKWFEYVSTYSYYQNTSMEGSNE